MSLNAPSFDSLLENIDKLRDISTDGELNIVPYLLSDDEAVKRLLSIGNNQMSKEDIDLIVDSEEDLLAKDDELEEDIDALSTDEAVVNSPESALFIK